MWEGEREVAINVSGYGAVCDMYWDSRGRRSSTVCPDCDWGFDLRFRYVGDILGACDGSSWYPSYTVSYRPDYYFTGYGYYDLMYLYYSSTWYFAGLVDDWDGEYLSYSTSWYQYRNGYYYLYYWYGTANLY